MALGWALARADWDVTMVETNPQKLAAGQRDGLTVDGIKERRVRFCAFADWAASDEGIVLLCTKTYDNDAVLRLLDASDHPCEGIASFVSQCERDRPTTRITRPGDLFFGGRRCLHKEERSVLESLADGLRQGGCKQVRVVDFIEPYTSSTQMYSAALSPLAASAGIDNGQLLSDPIARSLFFALLKENYSILRRHGVRLARIGPFPPWVVNRILRLPGLGQALAHLFRPGLAGTYCSMASDIGTGRTEVSAYNGHLKRLAGNESSPVNTAVLDLINRMQERSLPPCRARLSELRDALGAGGAV